jgi:S-DNA-T family DNA segregation ATPase FtsK/SpoIIIE
VTCPDLTTLAAVAGESVDLRRVWAGHTEYGQNWYLPLAGSASTRSPQEPAGRAKTPTCGAHWSPSPPPSATA